MIECPVFDEYYMYTMFTLAHHVAGSNVQNVYGVIVLDNLQSSYGIHFTHDYQNILFIHPFPVSTACIY